MFGVIVQVNLCYKLFFLHQPTNNMTTDCSLFMKTVSSEYLQNMLCTQIVVFNFLWHSEQFWYTTCSADVASFWKRFTCTTMQQDIMLHFWVIFKEVFRTCNVLPFSCTHLALCKRPEVHAKQKGFKNFFSQSCIFPRWLLTKSIFSKNFKHNSSFVLLSKKWK